MSAIAANPFTMQLSAVIAILLLSVGTATNILASQEHHPQRKPRMLNRAGPHKFHQVRAGHTQEARLYGGHTVKAMPSYVAAMVTQEDPSSPPMVGCGGVLMSPGIVVAAAHCLFLTYGGAIPPGYDTMKKARIVIGQKTVPDSLGNKTHPKTEADGIFKIKAAYKHSLFNSSGGPGGHDFLVVFLETCATQFGNAFMAGAGFPFELPVAITEYGWGMDESGKWPRDCRTNNMYITKATQGGIKVDAKCKNTTTDVWTPASGTAGPADGQANGGILCFPTNPDGPQVQCDARKTKASCLEPKTSNRSKPWCTWNASAAPPTPKCFGMPLTALGPGPMDSGSPFFARHGSTSSNTHVGLVSGGGDKVAILSRTSYAQDWLMEALKHDKCIHPDSDLKSYFNGFKAGAKVQAPSAVSDFTGGTGSYPWTDLEGNKIEPKPAKGGAVATAVFPLTAVAAVVAALSRF